MICEILMYDDVLLNAGVQTKQIKLFTKHIRDLRSFDEERRFSERRCMKILRVS